MTYKTRLLIHKLVCYFNKLFKIWNDNEIPEVRRGEGKNRAREHFEALVNLALAVGSWYNAPNKGTEKFYRKKVRGKYKVWCEYRHDYIKSNLFAQSLDDFIKDLVVRRGE